MELVTAVNLIRAGVPGAQTPQHWADLGAGSGLFTQALASLLPVGSSVQAIDQHKSSLDSIEWSDAHITLIRTQADFSEIEFSELKDGFILANALHYIENKQAQLSRLKKHLTPTGRIIIVEYETDTPNQWVPYPITFRRMESVALNAGFPVITKAGTVPSAYHSGGMYAAVLS
jgi:trans-aconitate methyltransferase